MKDMKKAVAAQLEDLSDVILQDANTFGESRSFLIV